MSKKLSEKQQLIAKIIKLQRTFMQQRFMQQQRKSGVGAQEDYSAEDDDALNEYNQAHEKLAARLVDIAHQEQGTSR